MYIYQKTNGELYASNKYVPYEDRGYDTYELLDWFVAQANNREEAWNVLKKKTKKSTTEHPLSKKYVKKFIEEHWDD